MTPCDRLACDRHFAAAACACGATCIRCLRHQGGVGAAREWREAHRASCSGRSVVWEIEPRTPGDKDLVALSLDSDGELPSQAPCWCGTRERVLLGASRVRYAAVGVNDPHECQATWIFTRCVAGHLLDLPTWIMPAYWSVLVEEAYGFSRGWRPNLTRDPNRIAAAEAALLGSQLSLTLALLADNDVVPPTATVPNGVSLYEFITNRDASAQSGDDP